MRRHIPPLIILSLATVTVWYAAGLRMWTEAGPGAGLFPMIIGIGLLVGGGLWSLELAASQSVATPATPPEAYVRLGAQLLALLLFAALFETAGYVAVAIGLTVASAWIAGERSWLWIAVSAAIASFGVRYLFTLLGTPL